MAAPARTEIYRVDNTIAPLEEAKRVMHEHPDWSSEAVADYCGFNSRKYFHRVFKESLGMTPTQYQKATNLPHFTN